MNHVLLLDLVVVVYAAANGMLLTATPQACLALRLSSQDLGIIGAGNPAGYALSCLLCGRLFMKYPNKYVLIGGTLGAAFSMLGMSQARSAAGCVAAQLGYGVASGAFWPFASAWMLDFKNEGVSKIRLLRHYNMSWTTGSAVGLYAAGVFCDRQWIFETFYISAALTGLACLVASFIPGRWPASAAGASAEPPHAGRAIGIALLFAAVLANLSALATRSVALNNYAELNKALGFSADRVGIFSACAILSELAGFTLGCYYERWLGLRRMYVFIAGGLLASNLVFAFATGMTVLLAAVFLQGLVLAVAFQVCIVAATDYFATPRTGTTFHEATVGIGGMSSIAAGAVIAGAKSSGAETISALRLPFFCMAGVIVLALIAQLILLSARPGRRALLPVQKEEE